MNNYRQSGGGGFPAVHDAPVVYNRQIDIRQLLIDWVTAHHTIDPSQFATVDWRLGLERDADHRHLRVRAARPSRRVAPTRPWATSSAVWPVRASRSATARPLSRRASSSRCRPFGVSSTSARRASVGSVFFGDPALTLELAYGAGDGGLGRAVGLGQRGHPERPALLEQRQHPDAGRVPDAAAYGAHQASGLHHELTALLLEVAGHAGRI